MRIYKILSSIHNIFCMKIEMNNHIFTFLSLAYLGKNPTGVNFKPFKPNGIFHSYQMGPVHFHFKSCWVVIFSFIQISIEHSVSKQAVETLFRCHLLWHLSWVCTVYLCPTKRTTSPMVFELTRLEYII